MSDVGKRTAGNADIADTLASLCDRDTAVTAHAAAMAYNGIQQNSERVLMTKDLEIQGNIARLLIDKAPHGAILIVCSAVMLDNNSACKLQYRSESKSGEEVHFTGGGRFNSEIHDLLNEHSDYFALQGQPRWTSCLLTVNLKHGKVSMDLTYD